MVLRKKTKEGSMFREAKRFWRVARELRMIVRGLLSTGKPILAHMVVTRRCNLACGYCNEYDGYSQPVPAPALLERVDRLAELGLSALTMSGGEPLLHPCIEDIIRRARAHGMIAGLITNGYLLTPERIERFNAAGLDHLQISIDNVSPGPVSRKSLKVLDRQLRLLARYADFHVNINSVIGALDSNPQDALVIARRAAELGFTSTVGLVHDSRGQMLPLTEAERAVLGQIHGARKRSYSRFNRFQENIAAGRPNDWRCRAGARYLYICEDGLVHYCSQQRGWPAKPLAQYTRDDMRRAFLLKKPCAPSCTVSCVHQVSLLDFWRAPQTAPASATTSLVHVQTMSAGRTGTAAG
jgi:MoaA/NifB/PqqE/SkfB family radical SAM enzyme